MKYIVYLGIVSLFTDFATALINPILPIFVVTYLHASMQELGYIVAISTFISYAIRIFSGYLSDRYGKAKAFLIAGYGISAFSKPLLSFTHSYASVALLRGFERFGKALRSAPKDKMIAYFSNEHGKAFGLHKTFDIAGEFLGSLTLFAILYHFGQSEETIRSIFLATIVPGILALFILFFIPEIKAGPQTGSFFHAIFEHKNIFTELIFYFAFLLFLFSDAFLVVRAQTAHFQGYQIALLYLLYTFVQTLSSYAFGVAIDRWGSRAVFNAGLICGVLAHGALLLENTVSIVAAFALMGLFTVSTLNALRSLIASMSAKGSIYGLFYAGIALFGALGALLVGSVWEHFGMQSALWMSFAMTLVIAFLYLAKQTDGS